MNGQAKPEPVYRIKPLEWKKADGPLSECGEREAGTVFGKIFVVPEAGGWLLYLDRKREKFETAEAAKAAAEAHYRSRLMDALEEVTP